MKRFISVTISIMLASTTAYAGGFSQPDQSASAIGVANAFVATADDPSAVIYNPAGMAWHSGISVMAGVVLPYRDSSVRVPAGVGPNNGTEPTVGSIFATWAPIDSYWSAGFGFAPLYLANNEWSDAFGAAAGITKITVDHATIDAAYAINSSLALGLGADWYVTRANLTQGAQSFDGNDFASFGGHASLKWKFMPSWSLGLMARSGSKITISGQTADELSFTLPDEFTAGIAHDFADVWRLEVNGKWTRWSSLDNLNVVTGGVVTQANRLDLKDTFTIMTGLTWTWRPDSQFRIGYAYDQGANRSAGYHPVIADQDGHKLSLGAGGSFMHMHFDLAYSYTYYQKATTTGAFAGTYRDRRQTIALSAIKHFE